MSEISGTDLSLIPSVGKILEDADICRLIETYSQDFVTRLVKEEVANLRQALTAKGRAKTADREALLKEVVSRTVKRVDGLMQPSLRPVINGTGIVLHTGLGRAPLTEEAKKRLLEIAEGYCSLEISLESGERGHRGVHVEEVLCRLTGAEAACVVNNNAAAVLLVLNTLAFAREVVVSRGQLIEIGGSFRMPDVMEKSGVKMVEIGTTNKTHLRDYEKAISDETRLLCHVHTSNYRVKGFTKEVGLSELVELGQKRSIPVFQDLGGGVLVDLQKFGLPYEPVASESIAHGVDVVSFSGDKILGGPQSGIILGKRAYLDRIKANPLMRALRCDKLIYAALEATLKTYFKEQEVSERNRILKMFLLPLEELKRRGRRIIEEIEAEPSLKCEIKLEESRVQAGSGALPLESLASMAVTLRSQSLSTERLARKFRQHDPPIVGYVRNDTLFFDLKTIAANHDPVLIGAIKAVLLDNPD